MTELIDAWEKLHGATNADQGYIRLRLASIAACPTYAARRIGNDLEALLLEVSTPSLAGISEYPQSVGFEVSGEPLEPGRFGRTRLLLTLTHARFRDVFRSLCEDITRSLSSASSEPEAVRTFVSRLARWQAFLRRHEPEGLSREQRRGLFGELTFLQSLLSQPISGAAAVGAWKGCRGANHDFQFPAGSVEVKTTSASTPHSVHINNVSQLSDQGLNALFLHVITVEENDGGAISLPELVQMIRTELDGKAVEEFEESLVESGFLDIHQDAYASPRYSIRSKRFFQVSDGFPRLLPAALPSGVEDVKYAIAIAACKPFERDEQQALNQILAETETHDG